MDDDNAMNPMWKRDFPYESAGEALGMRTHSPVTEPLVKVRSLLRAG